MERGRSGVLCAWVLTRVPVRLWDKYSLALCLFGLLLLLLVLIPGLGATVNGARPIRSTVRLGAHARAGAFVGQVQPRAVSVRAAAAAAGADPGPGRHG